MTPKQLLFIQEYLVDQNATRAAIAAGYSEKNAGKIGPELLGKTRIKEEINKGLELKMENAQARAKKMEITKDRWVREIASIAFSNMDDFAQVTSNGIHIIRTEDRKKALGRVIRKFSETTSQHGGSQSIELHPKLPALEMLGKHFGWLKESIEHSGEIKSTGDRKIAFKEIFKTEKSRALALELAEEMCEQEENENGEDLHKSTS